MSLFIFVAVFMLVFLVVLLYLADCDLVLFFYSKFFPGSTGCLSGKVVWITGASSGIGEELAYQLARKGVKLILSARREKELKRVLEKCQSRPITRPIRVNYH